MTASKETLRHEALSHRERMDLRHEDPELAAEFFLNAIQPRSGQVVGGFWPKGREFDCTAVLDAVLKAGIACALPVIQKEEKTLIFRRWEEGDILEPGPFGILQPAASAAETEPDIVLVPFLAFDRRGYRLGYGGGYYDATLKALRKKKEIVAVGLGYAQQAVLFALPTEPHDEKLDWVVTPKEAHYFGHVMKERV